MSYITFNYNGEEYELQYSMFNMGPAPFTYDFQVKVIGDKLVQEIGDLFEFRTEISQTTDTGYVYKKDGQGLYPKSELKEIISDAIIAKENIRMK